MQSRLQAAPFSMDERCFFATRGMAAAEKLAPEFGKDRRDAPRRLVTGLEETTDAAVKLLHTTQCQHEVTQVAAVERAVGIGRKRCQLLLRGVAHEIRRSVVHAAHHPVAVRHDRLCGCPRRSWRRKIPRSPGRYAPIAVRHRDGVALDKLGTVVFVVEPFEQLPEFCIHNTTVFMQ